MGKAKQIDVRPIKSKVANETVRQYHYSGTVVNNSRLHLGVFYNGKLEGVMSFGSPFDKRKVLPLVQGTAWNGMLELNRMAFSDVLPKNSESRALSVAFKLIKKHYPHIEWILSFSDATQSGDGAIYRALGFLLTQIRKNTTLLKLDNGDIVASTTYTKGKHILKTGGAKKPEGSKPLKGFQLRYIYFLNKDARERLTVTVMPFSKIEEMGASMYKGVRRVTKANPGAQPGSGGALPTHALHNV